jgi:cell division protein FtsI/penicillin-binding protein 2
MKPLIMAAAINENKVKPDSKCPSCSGPRVIGGFTIRTFNNQYHPQASMTQVLENSDNTGMIFVGEKLGLEKVYSYLEKYGFGKKTNIDLEGEEEGNLRPKKDWREIDLATATFGQGIAVTQIQMLKGFAALANGGFSITPHVASKTSDDKKAYPVNFKKGDRILKEDTTMAVKDMLVSVTERSPLRFSRDLHPELKNYRIAAKSGTAQIPIAGHYDSNKTIGSVIGFVPAEKPRVLVYVRLIEPSVRSWGSDTAGPIFFNIMDDLLKHYGIPPRG